jgi:serine/threonine protein kinase
MQDLKGTLIDHYHIGDRIAKGGMSEIYRAQDIDTQQAVALKLVHNSNFEHCERFRHEVQTLATLNHPHIIPALAYGTHESWCYLATPYFANGTLDMQLSSGPLTLDEAGELLAQLGSALQFAHDRGILHRDIKPSNVLMQHKGYAYLADFGLASQMNSESGITASDYVIGTAEYMAPELAEERASVRSDIYALGILLYQLLTGRVPFKGQTPISTFLKHMSEAVIPPSSFNSAIPPAIEQIILQALEKKPAKRFKSIQAFVDAYHNALQLTDSSIIDEPASTVIQLLRSSNSITTLQLAQTNLRGSSRKPILSMLAATMILFISLLVGFTIYTPTLGDNGKASKLSRVDVVATTPPITSKIFNIFSLKGEINGSIPPSPPQKPAHTPRATQFLDTDQPSNEPGFNRANGHGDQAQHPEHNNNHKHQD